jgi:CBS-domain-containing membrane protein
MIFKMSIKEILKIIGAQSHGTGHVEKIISAAGGFIGIALPMWISFHYLDIQAAVLLTASMGASAVLLFAVPHSPLTQPWPVIGGHTISALIGITCAQLILNPLLAAPLGVALAIFAMHYLRCIHPPGGGSALAAVIGGSEVHALGYQFVLTPVLLNATIMLFSAIIVNYAFPWRRYPAYFKKRTAKDRTQKTGTLTHDDFEYAIKEIDSYIDIDEDDLARIYNLALKHYHRTTNQPEQIIVDNHYSNGEYGAQWSVRKVTGLKGDGQDAQVTYKIVDGDKLGATETCTLADFTNWQQYEVILDKATWHRIMRRYPTE